MKCTTVILIILLTSCSILKQSSKNKTDTFTRAESDSTSIVKSKTETRITESIDTTIHTPEVKSKTNDVVGLPFKFEDEKHLLERDEKGNTMIVTKSQQIQVKKKKVTETKAQIQSTVNEKQKTDTKVEQKNKVSEVKKTGLLIPWWIWVIVIVALLVWRFRKLLF